MRKYQLQRQDKRIEVMTEEQINMIKELLRKKMKTYQQIQVVYHPNILNALFLAGGPGSVKYFF